jgi:hypothetical protein
MFTNSLVAHSNTSRDTGREKRERRKSHRGTGQRKRYTIYWEKGCLVREKKGEQESV